MGSVKSGESKNSQWSGDGCKTVEVEGESEARLPATNQPDGLLPPQTSKEETLANLRGMIKQEEEKTPVGVPASAESRSAKDIVGGIYRNDHGGVISKFAWEKLQRLKEKAESGGYQIDDYSQ